MSRSRSKERDGEPPRNRPPPPSNHFFRGEPIAWLTVPTTKTVVTANAFGDSEASERPGRKNHFILYGGKQYKREEFYQMAFP